MKQQKAELTIEEIPSGELMQMSISWHNAFNVAGCNPMCHCCEKMIAVGNWFKLSVTSTFRHYPPYMRYNNSIDVMLCDKCTVEQYEEKVVKDHKLNWEYKAPEKSPSKRYSGGGCFRINGKIIH